MAASVSVSDLKALVGTQSPDAAVQLFATLAEDVANDLLSGQGYNDARLGRIALFLGGHYWVLSRERGGLRAAKVGMSEDMYVGTDKSQVGFMSTRFGQQACVLDTAGVLQSASQQKLVQFAFRAYGYRGNVSSGQSVVRS